MDKIESIERFSLERPISRGIYGYGSSIFKQSGQNPNKAQIDLIFVVEDLKEWHHENLEKNPKDYSFLGSIHFSKCSLDKLKGKNNITYLSNIRRNGSFFKYGVIEIDDFLHSLQTWENLFIAGRFHKPTLNVKSEDVLDKAIKLNRRSAFLLACVLSNSYTDIVSFYTILCGLSYIGDVRMFVAENPEKVKNIVNGSLDIIKKLYPLESPYLFKLDDNHICVRHDIVLRDLKSVLPSCLLAYLEEKQTNFSSLGSVRFNILSFMNLKNKEESQAQIIEGFKSNGVTRSLPYLLAKVKKKFLRR